MQAHKIITLHLWRQQMNIFMAKTWSVWMHQVKLGTKKLALIHVYIESRQMFRNISRMTKHEFGNETKYYMWKTIWKILTNMVCKK